MKLLKYVFTLYLNVTIIGCASKTNLTYASKNISVSGGDSCQEGTTRQGFTSPTVSGQLHCTQEVQTCTSGKWQGPVLYPTCENLTKTCDGQPHGSTVSGYLQPTTPLGVPCTPATKTCLNGSWAGPEIFSTCSQL